MATTDEYAAALIRRLEDKGDGLSREAATFIRAERTRIAGYRKLIDLQADSIAPTVSGAEAAA